MMTHTDSLRTINQPSEIVIPRMTSMLMEQGLQVERSFDLRTAREAHVGCTCPHHGTERCDCQIVVLLVYGEDDNPATLVAHGRDGRTRFALANHPEGEFLIPFVDEIKRLFQVGEPLSRKEDSSHVR